MELVWMMGIESETAVLSRLHKYDEFLISVINKFADICNTQRDSGLLVFSFTYF